MGEQEGKTQYHVTKCKFIGRSKEGRPIKVMIGEDITRLRTVEIELEQKQKKLDDALEKQEYLGQFFNQCPNLKGICELNENDHQLVLKLANPAALAYSERTNGKYIHPRNTSY